MYFSPLVTHTDFLSLKIPWQRNLNLKELKKKIFHQTEETSKKQITAPWEATG